MKRFVVNILLVIMVLCSSQLLHAQTGANPDDKQAPRKRGGVFTMYVLDPLARTLCFSDGKEGMAFVNNQWGNRCSDLSYSPAGNGSFVAGIEQNRMAAIVDLGSPNDLRTRYGFEDADNGGVGFGSLRIEGDKVTILREYNSKTEPKLLEVKSSATAAIKLGHIYLVRIADTKNKSFQQTVKLMVIAYRPDEAVTLRWELL
jgi:hypothetical protein